jgi:hypothetical protein
VATVLKTAYFKLYESIYLDVDPYLPLEKAENHTFQWDSLYLNAS